ncbi:MAG TPA: hypothetical protein VG410_03445 [Solirubrobacteraceae bacterium]|nr:hypothetical protein [Solirubrobacteraceae bacterium]
MSAATRTVSFAAALLGSALLIVAEFSTLRGVRALQADVLRVSAGGNHGYALIVIAVLALPVAVWAMLRRSRLAALALIIAGAAAAYVILAVDRPVLGSTAPVDQLYTSTSAWTGSAIYWESAGAALLLASGAVQALLPGRARARKAARAIDR